MKRTKKHVDLVGKYCKLIAEYDKNRFGDVFNEKDVKQFANKLFEKHDKPIFISRGKDGILACDKNGIHQIPGIKFQKQLDTVGAGDTSFSAISCAMGANISIQETISFANLASGVTVQKLFCTGTASPEEIIILNETKKELNG